MLLKTGCSGRTCRLSGHPVCTKHSKHQTRVNPLLKIAPNKRSLPSSRSHNVSVLISSCGNTTKKQPVFLFFNSLGDLLIKFSQDSISLTDFSFAIAASCRCSQPRPLKSGPCDLRFAAGGIICSRTCPVSMSSSFPAMSHPALMPVNNSQLVQSGQKNRLPPLFVGHWSIKQTLSWSGAAGLTDEEGTLIAPLVT